MVSVTRSVAAPCGSEDESAKRSGERMEGRARCGQGYSGVYDEAGAEGGQKIEVRWMEAVCWEDVSEKIEKKGKDSHPLSELVAHPAQQFPPTIDPNDSREAPPQTQQELMHAGKAYLVCKAALASKITGRKGGVYKTDDAGAFGIVRRRQMMRGCRCARE
jgi:hypothetical protein